MVRLHTIAGATRSSHRTQHAVAVRQNHNAGPIDASKTYARNQNRPSRQRPEHAARKCEQCKASPQAQRREGTADHQGLHEARHELREGSRRRVTRLVGVSRSARGQDAGQDREGPLKRSGDRMKLSPRIKSWACLRCGYREGVCECDRRRDWNERQKRIDERIDAIHKARGV